MNNLIKNIVILHLFLFLEINDTNAQTENAFAKLNLFSFTNINWKLDNSVQIKPIKELFSSYDLVVLSESTHYDGATLDAQNMIIKELIDSGIINTLYIETSSLNAENIMHILRSGAKDAKLKAKNYCASGDLIGWVENDFWDYLAAKIMDKKIDLVGLDIETTSDLLVQELYGEALKLPEISKLKNSDSLKFAYLDKSYSDISFFSYDLNFSESEYQRHVSFITTVLAEYKKSNNERRYNQWDLIQKYFYWIYERQYAVTEKNYNDLVFSSKSINSFHSVRDSIMAGIFFKDYNKRKNVKAIVRIFAYHALRNYKESTTFEETSLVKGTHILGEILNNKIGNKMYSICFVAGSGEWGSNILGRKNLTKVKPKKGSFEKFFRNKEHPYFFTDLQSSVIKDDEFLMEVVFQKAIRAKWGQIFSGLFYIKKMYPTSYLHLEKHITDAYKPD
jgi:erythromycin esterase-like protein